MSLVGVIAYKVAAAALCFAKIGFMDGAVVSAVASANPFAIAERLL